MKISQILIIVCLLLVGCKPSEGSIRTAIAETSAVESTVEARFVKTLTAQVPTLTSSPFYTETPTPYFGIAISTKPLIDYLEETGFVKVAPYDNSPTWENNAYDVHVTIYQEGDSITRVYVSTSLGFTGYDSKNSKKIELFTNIMELSAPGLSNAQEVLNKLIQDTLRRNGKAESKEGDVYIALHAFNIENGFALYMAIDDESLPVITGTPPPTKTTTPTKELTPSDTPTITLTPNATQTLEAILMTPKGDGFYLVGVDISPGVWRSEAGSDSCYWARTKTNGDIIDNHFGMSGGTIYISSSDFQIEFDNCGTWTWISPP